MLPRQLHLDEINRYHDTIARLSKQIDVETDIKKKNKLSLDYYTIIKIWSEIDDVIEFTIKHTLDCVENGDDPNG